MFMLQLTAYEVAQRRLEFTTGYLFFGVIFVLRIFGISCVKDLDLFRYSRIQDPNHDPHNRITVLRLHFSTGNLAYLRLTVQL